MKIVFFVAVFCISTGAAFTQDEHMPWSELEKTTFWSLTAMSQNEAERVGAGIGEYGFNVSPFGRAGLKTRNVGEWYVWGNKPFSFLDFEDAGNYLQLAVGNKWQVTHFLSIDPNVSFYLPQPGNEIWEYQKNGTWIFNMLMVMDITGKSMFVKSETNQISFWFNRFEHVSGGGSNFNYRLAHKKSLKTGGMVESKVWFNQGIFGTDKGVSAGVTLTSRTFLPSEKVGLKAFITGMFNVTRKAENPLTKDTAILGLSLSKK